MAQLTKSQRITLREHIKDDCLHLSCGFLRRLVLGNAEEIESAVLQIQRCDVMHGDFCAKVTVCDGINYHEGCFLTKTLHKEVNKLGSNGETFAVILVRTDGIHYQESSNTFFVRHYDFICMAEKREGSPLPEKRVLQRLRKTSTKKVFLPITVGSQSARGETESEVTRSDNIAPPTPTPRRSRVALLQRVPPSAVGCLPSSAVVSTKSEISVARDARPVAVIPPNHSQGRVNELVPAAAVLSPARSAELAIANLHIGNNPSSPPDDRAESSKPRNADYLPLKTAHHPTPSAKKLRPTNKDTSFAMQQSSTGTKSDGGRASNGSKVTAPSASRQSINYSQNPRFGPPPPFPWPQSHCAPGMYNQLSMPFPQMCPPPYQRIPPPPLMALPVVPPQYTNIRSSHRKVTIGSLTPKTLNWYILGKCTGRDDRLYETKKGEKVFNFDLTDETGTSIRVISYGEFAVDLFKMVQFDCNYSLSHKNADVIRVGERRFNTTGHAYQLTIKNLVNWQPAHDMSIAIPQLKLNVVPLSELVDMIGTMVDILAIIKDIQPVRQVGSNCEMREVELIDKTDKSVNLVLWNTHARLFSEDLEGQVLGIKGALVEEHRGKISINAGSRMTTNPELPAVEELLEWHDRTNYLEEEVDDLTQPYVVMETKLNKKHLTQIVPLDQLPQFSEQTVHVMAVVDKIGPIVQAPCKGGQFGKIRTIDLTDQTSVLVKWTLQNEDAVEFSEDLKGRAVGIMGAFIKKKIKNEAIRYTLQGGTYDVELDPKLAGVNELKKWYQTRKLAQNTEGNQQHNHPVAKLTLNVVPLSEVPRNSKKLIDILAVVDNVDPVIVNPLDNKTSMRKVQLVDETLAKVNLVLLGGRANNFSAAEGTVVGIKASAVKKDPLTGSFFITAGKRLVLKPEVRGVEHLREWYDVVYLDP